MISFLFIVLIFAVLGLGAYFTVRPKENTRGFVLHPARAVSAAVVVILICMMWSGIRMVDGGNVGVVKRNGNPIGELKPGLHLVNPLFDTVTDVTTQTRVVKPSEDAASHDLQVVHVEVTVAYHVDPAHATDILVQLNDDAIDRVINPAALEAIKATTAQYDVKELVGNRAKVRDGIETMIAARLLPNHIFVDSVSITDFKFSKEFEAAIESKVTAEQQAEKAKNDLVRISTEAEQKVAQAKGEAEALRSQKLEITPELLQLRTIEMLNNKWDGKLPDTILGGSGISGLIPTINVRKQ
jgi:prohibitin 2